jgi:hypothetical protein
MSWIASAVEQLASQRAWAYRPGSAPATEPTALAALALQAYGRAEDALRACTWLASMQAPDGSLGVTAGEATPCWPTSLAVLAWQFSDEHSASKRLRYRTQIERGLQWLLQAKGDPLERTTVLGHDSTIIGWPWVLGTHSWLEPTAWAVIALKRCGQQNNPRSHEGVRMLIDRLLPTGGANYGNTFVLGQKLRPQIEPTGLALIALAGEPDASGRIDAACTYLARNLSASTPGISLSYGLLGLAAHAQSPPPADDWLQIAFERAHDVPVLPLKCALLLLAARGAQSPLLAAPQLARRA